MTFRYKIILLLVLPALLFTSCVDVKKAVYFNNIPDAILESSVFSSDPIIKKNDLLNISVSSLNPEATRIFNTPNDNTNPGAVTTNGIPSATGYLVDQDGNIQFAMLGNLKAVGLTKSQLKESITKSLTEKKLLVDPIVVIRFLNYKVTVLGEVARPNVINVANEKITLLEALGLAGDLTIYGKRENIMILREEDGKKIVKRVNLNTNDILTSPYYYLQNNDIVYVEPNKERISSSRTTSSRNLSILISILSFATTILYLVSN